MLINADAALRMARQFCQADPSAVVLVVSVELCSLHLRVGDAMDSLLANAIFAASGQRLRKLPLRLSGLTVAEGPVAPRG